MQAEERVISIVDLQQRDGEHIARVVLNQLETLDLPTDGLVSQTHDGASVMSGKRKGVQAIISRTLKRDVPYIHCFAHQLHLVVVWAMKSSEEVIAFFDHIQALTALLRKSPAREAYEGAQLRRLLDQRWSGHHDAVVSFLANKKEIREMLETLSSSGESEIRRDAAGILQHGLTPKMLFVATTLDKIFAHLEPLNRMLQAQKLEFSAAMSILHATEVQLQTLLQEGCGGWLPGVPEPKRIRVTMGVHVIEREIEGDEDRRELQLLFRNLVESVLEEIRERFSERNIKLLTSLAFLQPGPNFLDKEKLQPLIDFTTRFFPQNCNAEIDKEIEFAKFLWETAAEDKGDPVKFFLSPGRSPSFPRVCTLLRVSLTFGATSAQVERGFSHLTRLLTPSRLSMTQDRKADLVLLSTNADITKEIDLDEFVRVFALKGDRRLLML